MITAQKIKNAALWSVFESAMSMLLSMLMILFIARLLTPTDYGNISIVQITSGLLQIVLGMGLSETIIQKNKLDKKHIQVFWSFSLISGLIGSLFCLVIGYMFLFYNNTVAYIFYFEAITIFFLIFSLVPTAIFFKELNIKKIVFINIFSRSIFFVIAIPMFYLNYGLWSVVIATVIQNFLFFILVVVNLKNIIRFKFIMDYELLKESYKFSFFVMLENMLWNVLTRVLGIFIAILHGSNAIGLYNMASKLVDTITAILNMTISRLTLPIFSSLQNDRQKLLSAFQKATLYFNLFSMPAFFCMTITAKYWVLLLLGNDWLNIVPIVQILAVMYGIMYSRIFVGNTIKALGKSKEYLYLSLIAALITLLALFFTKNQTLIILLFTIAIPRIVITIPLGALLMKNICGFSFYEQFNMLVFPITLTLLLSSTLFIVQIFIQDISWLTFMLQLSCCGIIFSVCICFYLKRYVS